MSRPTAGYEALARRFLRARCWFLDWRGGRWMVAFAPPASWERGHPSFFRSPTSWRAWVLIGIRIGGAR